ncbi:sensor histidine kinase [Nostoc cycadae]|uniref:histidine kinase n=1 Tax=Nostoc cycadae WK-1 TaxID=1861711 RepID=A0A2H6LR73_9NOSO|nr:ATP-binding protein [Nostoc cycadae]GBE92848.1 two-component sensor histidine kinase [Nostoc cycadae WK-1]GBE95684.1 two-component sensor histidine kinase [Nostoc cycadae WK-1]
MQLDYEQKIKQLEKANRILQKKLERSESLRIALEETNEKKEALFLKVIDELRDSQKTLEEQSRDLEETLKKLRAMQSKLVESEKMSALGVLVAGIAHEINNPVNFIYGNINYVTQYAEEILELLKCYQEYYPNPVITIADKIKKIDLEFIKKDFVQVLQSMEIGSQRISEIVRSLRTFSRLDEAELKKVNIHEGIDSTLMILQNRLNSQLGCLEVIIIKEYGNLPRVECYAGKLNQVLINIISNAIDALEQKLNYSQHTYSKTNGLATLQTATFTPTIKITTELINNWVSIRISDNGIGIDEKTTQQIFNPFFTTKPVGKGTGLGLSISYQIIVETHQGQLECQSIPGVGTEFMIMIPLQRL